MSAFAAIAFGREHIDHLGAAQDKGLELLSLLVVQGSHLGLDGRAVVGDDTGIDAIGLGEPSSGLGEIAHPFWIDRDAGQAGLAQGLEDGSFELAGGFEHDPLGIEEDQFRDQGGDTVGGIGHTEVLVALAKATSRNSPLTSMPTNKGATRIEFGLGSPQHPYLQKIQLEAQSTVQIQSGEKRRHQLSFGHSNKRYSFRRKKGSVPNVDNIQ